MKYNFNYFLTNVTFNLLVLLHTYTRFIFSSMVANHCGFHEAIPCINTHRLLLCNHKWISKHWNIVFSWFPSISCVHWSVFFLCLPVRFLLFSHKYNDKSRLLRLDWLLEADGSLRLDNWDVTHRTDRLFVRSVSHCWWRCKHCDAALRGPANHRFAFYMWTSARDAIHVHSFICNHINKRHTRTARRRCNGKEKCNPPFILW